MTTATHDAQTTILDANDESDDTREGLYPDMPSDEYYDDSRVGSTAIRHALGTPAEYAHWRESEPDGSDGMALGHAIHQAILEPDEWAATLASRPPVDVDDMYWRERDTAEMAADGATVDEIADKIGVKPDTVQGYLDEPEVQTYLDHLDMHDGDICDLSDDEIETVERCRDAVIDHDEAGALLDGTQREVAVMGEIDGLPCRGRLDAWNPDSATIIELKTVDGGRRMSAKPDSHEGWGYTVARRDYHVQAGMYWRLVQEAVGPETIVDYRWVVVETSAPHLVGVYPPSEDLLEEGVRCVEEGLETVQRYRNGDRSGYDCSGSIDIPHYAYRHDD